MLYIRLVTSGTRWDSAEKIRGSKLTGVCLRNEEENEPLLSGESRDVDVLIFLVLQDETGKGVSNVNSHEVCAGRPLVRLVEFSLIVILNIWVDGKLMGGFSDLFRTVFLVFLAIIVLCTGFFDIALFAGRCGFFGWFCRLLN